MRHPEQRPLAEDMAVPSHGPGCKPIQGSHSHRFPGEPKYVCVPGCPRRRYLDRWLASFDVKAK